MEKEPLRDRTYKEISDGDYLDNSQYMVVAVSLGITHLHSNDYYQYFQLSVICCQRLFDI